MRQVSSPQPRKQPHTHTDTPLFLPCHTAESTYYDILDEDVLCWQALIDRARMNLASGKWALAMYDLVMVRAMGKADADVLNDLGVSHFELSHDSKAAECFTEAVGKSPNHAAAFANRANVYKRQGRLREAEESLRREQTPRCG